MSQLYCWSVFHKVVPAQVPFSPIIGLPPTVVCRDGGSGCCWWNWLTVRGERGNRGGEIGSSKTPAYSCVVVFVFLLLSFPCRLPGVAVAVNEYCK